MRAGDRIAIKKMVGGKDGKGRVLIRAIGTVMSLNRRNKRVLVRWEKTGLDREVAGHSLFWSVHGPYDSSSAIVQDVFQEASGPMVRS